MSNEKTQVKNNNKNNTQRFAKVFDNRQIRVVLIIGFLGLFLVILLFSLQYLSQIPKLTTEVADQQIPSNVLKNRSGPLYGIGGVIGSIEGRDAEKKVVIIKTDLGVDYQVMLSANTAVFAVTNELTETEVKATKVQIKASELKEGERVYLEANKDLLNIREIPTENIRSIEVFKN